MKRFAFFVAGLLLVVALSSATLTHAFSTDVDKQPADKKPAATKPAATKQAEKGTVAKPDDTPPEATPRDPRHHYLATAKTYNMQSHDHARMLQKYVALHGNAPAEVVQEHVGAIRFNTQATKRSLDRLAKSGDTDEALNERLQQMQARLDKVNLLVKQLDAEVAENRLEANSVVARTKAISHELRQNHADVTAVDNDFYNSNSDSYYTTGEGHFVD